MAPKKNLADDIEELKNTLEFLAKDVAEMKQQQKEILGLVEEVKSLKMKNAEKDKIIVQLESRVADLEQYSRLNDIIISGLDIKPRSYSQAVKHQEGGEHTGQESVSAEEQVAVFFQTKGITLDTNNVEACHPLPRRLNKTDRPAVILRFVNRKSKLALLKQGRQLKGTNVYLNEHLTKKNADIARKARLLRYQKKIQATWTSNCKIFIKLNGTPEQAKVLVIRNLEELDKFNDTIQP